MRIINGSTLSFYTTWDFIFLQGFFCILFSRTCIQYQFQSLKCMNRVILLATFQYTVNKDSNINIHCNYLNRHTNKNIRTKVKINSVKRQMSKISFSVYIFISYNAIELRLVKLPISIIWQSAKSSYLCVCVQCMDSKPILNV